MGMSPTGSVEKAASSREEILQKLRERIVRFAASKIQRDAAEDLAQEVLLVLHEKYGHLERLEDLLPLSLEIVRFKLMAYRRKAQRHGEYTQVPVDEIQVADGGPDPLTAAESREMRERLLAAISQLGERCRKIMALKLEGKSFPEIRSILGAASINTIYTWDFRCRKHLLELMGGSWAASAREESR
jgi:RNA polymerase sigma-70 factor (ECF subfamily)